MASTRWLVLRYNQLRDKMFAGSVSRAERDEMDRVYSALYARGVFHPARSSEAERDFFARLAVEMSRSDRQVCA